MKINTETVAYFGCPCKKKKYFFHIYFSCILNSVDFVFNVKRVNDLKQKKKNLSIPNLVLRNRCTPSIIVNKKFISIRSKYSVRDIRTKYCSITYIIRI